MVAGTFIDFLVFYVDHSQRICNSNGLANGLLLTPNILGPGIDVSSIYPVLLELERCGPKFPPWMRGNSKVNCSTRESH
jgi:hypothetical protein